MEGSILEGRQAGWHHTTAKRASNADAVVKVCLWCRSLPQRGKADFHLRALELAPSEAAAAFESMRVSGWSVAAPVITRVSPHVRYHWRSLSFDLSLPPHFRLWISIFPAVLSLVQLVLLALWSETPKCSWRVFKWALAGTGKNLRTQKALRGVTDTHPRH